MRHQGIRARGKRHESSRSGRSSASIQRRRHLASAGQCVEISETQVAVEQLAQFTQLNAALVEESAAASGDLDHQAQLLEGAVNVLMC
ncbi:hypothetical protein J8I87_00585 [Paraburkholderia sp. LEh10]|uniref:hypothetical protein n=1 Tax=Paraburkholderia sp. LEh10 TaxID=2821353 RepID=UPI001AEB2781|nr:hypothetical protein [Paraburkholderia sp. LEh10]MBP0588242.1 hypothetical protein [Paraburkholderia sp. LEh10]